MSAYAEFRTEFRDADVLVAALEAVCPEWQGKIEVHDKPVHLVGYVGDTRAQQAHVVIRRQHVGSASNDIGFEYIDGRYVARISNYDSSRHGEEWRNKLTVAYGREMVTRKAAKLGYRVAQTQRADGSVQMVLTR